MSFRPLSRRSMERGSREVSRAARRRAGRWPAVERLETRRAPAGIINGDFAIADPGDPEFGWQITGDGAVIGGAGQLDEGEVLQTRFEQTFTIEPGTTALQFTIVGLDLAANGGIDPPDAFEVALLDAATSQSLVGTATGLGATDAFLNIQTTGEVYFGPEVTVPDVAMSGDVASLSLPTVITVDLQGVAAGTEATLFFDLIGFTPAASVARIDDVTLLVNAPPPLEFALSPSSDTGAAGDDLTGLTPVDLVGTTDPGQEVLLDVDGDGFDDGAVIADANGDFTFTGVALAEGANEIRMEATNADGTSTATRTITLDSQAPTGVLVAPAPGSTVAQVPGYVDVQWADAGDAGLDPDSFGTDDITISGVTIDSFEVLAPGLVRYHYDGDDDALTDGPIEVTLLAGQVSDLAGNSNAEVVTGFTIDAGVNTPPVAVDDAYTATEGTPLAIDAPGVLDNDTDGDGDELTAVLVAGPTSGTLDLQPDGSFVYTPDAGFTGSDSFTYRADDGEATSEEATVTITVQAAPANTPPVAADDVYAATPDTPLAIDAPGVLGNDTDGDGDELTAVLVAGPTSGTLDLQPDGSFVYTPDAGFTGSDSFTYRADDGEATSEEATVTITVQAAPANTPPVIEDDDLVLSATSIPEGGSITLSGTFTDPDVGQVHTIVIDWGDGSPAQTLTLAVGARSFGPVTHTYIDDDPTGTPSDPATITVTVTDDEDADDSASSTITVVNVAPTVDIGQNRTVDEGSAVTLTATITDPGANDTHSVNWSVVRNGQHFAGGTGTTFTFTADDDGTYLVSATAIDDDTGAGTDTVFITVRDVPPTLTIDGPGVVTEGDDHTISLTSEDPGDDTIQQWVIDWGDGEVETIPGDPATASHTYQLEPGPSDAALPDLPFIDALRDRRALAPERFDTYHPWFGFVLAAEQDATIRLPILPAIVAAAEHRALDPVAFDAARPFLGFMIARELAAPPQPATYTIRATATNEDGTFTSNAISVQVTPAGQDATPDAASGATTARRGAGVPPRPAVRLAPSSLSTTVAPRWPRSLPTLATGPATVVLPADEMIPLRRPLDRRPFRAR